METVETTLEREAMEAELERKEGTRMEDGEEERERREGECSRQCSLFVGYARLLDTESRSVPAPAYNGAIAVGAGQTASTLLPPRLDCRTETAGRRSRRIHEGHDPCALRRPDESGCPVGHHIGSRVAWRQNLSP
jgi:hypothetical protein